MLFQVMIYNFRGPRGPSSPSNAPQNSPQILLFLGDERQIAAQKANESKNLSYLTHIIRKDLTKNASGQITDHYDLP